MNRENNADSLISEIKTGFEERSLSLRSIEFVFLANGPGSFTGLRIGSVISKGICFISGAKLIEVNSIDIIAEKSSSVGNIICLINSNMKTGEFYFAEYFKSKQTERISEYGLIHPEDIKPGIIAVVTEDSVCNINSAERVTTDTIEHLFTIGKTKRKFGEYSDSYKSEPFYIKQFNPVTKTRK